MAGPAALFAAVALIAAAGMAHASGFRFRGCVTVDDRAGPHGSGACAPGHSAALIDLTSLARSDEGASRSLYTGAALDCHGLDNPSCFISASVGRFKLKQQSGALRYRDCLTGASNIRSCDPVPSATRNAFRAGLGAVTALAASPDGRSVYATSNRIVCIFDDAGFRTCYGSDVLTTFGRDLRTGALTYQGCITGDERSGPTGSGACAQIPSATADGQNSGLEDLEAVALSPDGTSLYVAASDDAAVARFDRNLTTGALTYRGCVTGEQESGPAGSGACQQTPSATARGFGSGLDQVSELAVSQGGKAVYATAAGDSSLAAFDRDPGKPERSSTAIV